MPPLEPVRGLTWRSFGIGFLLVLGWLLYDATLAVYPRLNMIEMVFYIGFGAIFTLFAVQFLNNLVPEGSRLTPQELTVVYAMVAVAIPWGIVLRGALEGPMSITINYTGKDDPTHGWLHSLWTVKHRDAQNAFRTGGVSWREIRWDLWAKPLVYWGAMMLSFQAFAVCVVLFMRRIYVDEEKLPYPMAQVGRSIIQHRPVRAEDASSRKLKFAIQAAFILGLLFCAPGIFSITPESATPVPMNTTYYGMTTGLIPGKSIALSWDPFVLCFLMFFPLDVLFTAMVFHIGFQMGIPVVCSWLGVPSPAVSGWEHQIFGMGGMVGLAFWPLFFNRRRVWDFIKRGLTPGRGEEKTDPVSYRFILWGTVLSFAVFMTLFIVGLVDWKTGWEKSDLRENLEEHVYSLILCAFMLVVMVLALTRQMGEAGWHYHSPWSVAKIISYTHTHYLGANIFRTQASFLSIGNILNFGAYQSAFAPHLNAMYSLKIAGETNTRVRDVVRVIFITLLLALLIMLPLYLVLIHHFGFEHGAAISQWFSFWKYSQPMHAIAYTAIPTFFNRIPPWVSIPIGVALVGIVMYLRREYVGFPLSPVGVVMTAGWAYFSSAYGTRVIWLPIVIVFVVKRVIYKWFGVKFFRERVVPVMLFAMMGLMTGMLIYKLIFACMGLGFLGMQ